MTPNLRRMLLLVAITLVGVSMLVILYFLFFRAGAPTNGNVNGAVNGGQLPGVANGNLAGVVNINGTLVIPTTNGGFVPVTKMPGDVADPNRPTYTRPMPQLPAVGSKWTVASDGSSVHYYDAGKGQFFRSSADGTTRTLLSSTYYPDVQTVTWSKDATKAVLTFPDQAKVVVDFSKGTQATLARETDEFNWSPDGSRLVFKYLGANPDDRYLVTTNADGTGANPLEKMGENDAFVTTNWSPDGRVVATFQQGATATQSDILLVGANNENLPAITVPGRNFIGLWSSDGSRMLFSVVSPLTRNNPELFIVDARGDTTGRNMLDLGLTVSADKCVFSTTSASTVYCAVPDHLDPDSGLFPGLTQDETDRFYRIDTSTGQFTVLVDPIATDGRVQFNASNLRLSIGEDVLYFTDAATGQVYTVRLR